MSKRTFLGLVVSHTFRRSVIFTDRAAILIGPLVTSYYWLRGGPMPEGIDGLIAIGVLITAGGALLARFISAPFVIWKRDQAHIRRLRSDLSRPERRAREMAQEHKADLRKELGDRIARIIALVELQRIPVIFKETNENVAASYFKEVIRAREIINALSYDVILRVCCLNIIDLCSKVAKAISLNDNTETQRLLNRLWAQRKLTFQLLHYEYRHDILVLAQVETLIAADRETFRPKGERSQDSIEIDDAMLELRKTLKEHPELISKIDQTQFDDAD